MLFDLAYETLSEWIWRAKDCHPDDEEQMFCEYKIMYYFYQLCNAVHKLHNMKIVHLDIKPDNIFIFRQDERPKRVLKLGDFGISKCLWEDSKYKHTGQLNKNLMPPDYRMAKDLEVGYKTDIWQLGVILFQMITL